MVAYTDWNPTKIGVIEMQYKPLNQMVRFEKAKILANKIIVKALQSDRGDIVRAMNAQLIALTKNKPRHSCPSGDQKLSDEW